MSQAVPPQPTAAPVNAARSSALTSALAVAAIAALLAFIAGSGRALYQEWSRLQVERVRVRHSAVIGYLGISPRHSYARRPDQWVRDEGDSTMLWSGWVAGAGHRWFRVGRGEVEISRISEPIGRDVIQAIDHPVVERVGGAIWGRIPDEAPVVGYRFGGVDTAYPVLLLDKVAVVNDAIRDQPFLVLSNPLVPQPHATAVYETVIDGRRVTMGLSGYFQGFNPLLYDRGTESLWVSEGDGLRSIAGRHKGRRLREIARPAAVAWSRWRSAHPASRLVVGADRSLAPPAL